MSTTTPEPRTAIPVAPDAGTMHDDPFGASEDRTTVIDEPRTDPMPSSALDDVEKQVVTRAWHFEGTIKGVVRGQPVEEHIIRDYEQKPLSYIAMIQFTGLLGRKIDEAMAGPEGLKIESIAEIAEVVQLASAGGQLSAGAFAGIDSFVSGLAKISSYVPDVIEEAMCIWLRIPFRDRMLVREIWAKPVDEGGLSNDDGEEMMTLFLRQNYEEVERFFVERLRRMGKVVQEERRRLHPVTDEPDPPPSRP
jgi:hypothetical protein